MNARSHRRGQSALEFVLLSSVLLIGVAVLIIAAQRMLMDIAHDNDEKVIGALVQGIKAELALADAQPVGYTRTFSLPLGFDGFQYSVIIQEETEPASDSITIVYKGNTFFWFATQNVTGTIVPGQNSLRKTTGGLVLG